MPRNEDRNVRKGPAPPKAAVVSARLETLAGMAKQLDREYEQLYEWAHSIGMPTPEFGRGRPKGSVAIPTEGTALAPAKIRSRHAAYLASEKILDAVSKLRAAHDQLVRSLPDPERYVGAVEVYPGFTKEAELKQLREAQARRIERGEL